MFAEHYAKHYDLLNKNKPYRHEVEFIYLWAQMPKRILDLGCGTANYWNFFPSGVLINGIEKSIDMRKLSRYTRSIILGDICKMDYGQLYPYDLAMALFDVVNYAPNLSWIEKLPVKRGGFFIFDILEKKKDEKFERTERSMGNLKRIIQPRPQIKNKVTLDIFLESDSGTEKETHDLFLWTEKDIKKAAGTAFDIVETKETESWQKWYKLRKK